MLSIDHTHTHRKRRKRGPKVNKHQIINPKRQRARERERAELCGEQLIAADFVSKSESESVSGDPKKGWVLSPPPLLFSFFFVFFSLCARSMTEEAEAEAKGAM